MSGPTIDPHLPNLKAGITRRTGARTADRCTDKATSTAARILGHGASWLAFRGSYAEGRGVKISLLLTPEVIRALLELSAGAAVAAARKARQRFPAPSSEPEDRPLETGAW